MQWYYFLLILLLPLIVGYGLYQLYYWMDWYSFIPFKKPKSLSLKEENLIATNFPIYKEFSPELKSKCNERITWFRSKKHFTFYGEIERKEDIKLLLSATNVIMTIGLRNYQMKRSLLRIIVYPTQYYSRLNKRHHFGEYNPNFKTLVFAADKIWKGFEHQTDNRNLALHEFAHSLSFEMRNMPNWQGRKFRVGLRRIERHFEEEDFIIKLAASQYFREYGFTNLQEFFSVAVENYFETPSIFKNDFPELYENLKTMLNFDFHYNRYAPTFSTSVER